MKRLFAAGILALGITAALGAKTPEWLDPNMNAINRAPMHTSYFAFPDEKEAEGCKCSSTNYVPLNGTWRFNWVADADQRPTDNFYAVD